MTQAAASEVLKVRMVTHVTSVHSLDVGDTDGHIASVSRFSGLAFYPDARLERSALLASAIIYTGPAPLPSFRSSCSPTVRSAHLLQPEPVRRASEMAAKLRNGIEVGLLRRWRTDCGSSCRRSCAGAAG